MCIAFVVDRPGMNPNWFAVTWHSSQDLGVVKFIKEDDGKVLVKGRDIKLRWQNYFYTIFNSCRPSLAITKNPTTQSSQRNNCYCRNRSALKKMGRAKAVGPDNIPIEA
ncbi:hypothetical protein L1987_79599 [Smallanthus sonchifolius]|uniref:Uncharacterized protein n=1 Tax=Smallanthus sonchifolius TaxID=185202 RepID=A0ACB8YPJ7_9ASTR|nr:hypothetical protein L1987_79599 [Smallanthus sonchifolius]